MPSLILVGSVSLDNNIRVVNQESAEIDSANWSFPTSGCCIYEDVSGPPAIGSGLSVQGHALAPHFALIGAAGIFTVAGKAYPSAPATHIAFEPLELNDDGVVAFEKFLRRPLGVQHRPLVVKERELKRDELDAS